VRFLEQRLQSVLELYAVPRHLIPTPHHGAPQPLLHVGDEAQAELLGDQAFQQPLRIREVLLPASRPAIRLRLGEMECSGEGRCPVAAALP